MFNYIFYKLYKLAKVTEKQWHSKQRMPEVVALFLFSMLQFMNLITIYIVLIKEISFLNHFKLDLLLIVIIGLILYFVNYKLFIKASTYLKVEKRYDDEKRLKRKSKDIFFWLYILGSFIVMFTVFEIYSVR